VLIRTALEFGDRVFAGGNVIVVAALDSRVKAVVGQVPAISERIPLSVPSRSREDFLKMRSNAREQVRAASSKRASRIDEWWTWKPIRWSQSIAHFNI
jgi:hypothetical protein